MKPTTSFLPALLLIGGLVATGSAIAAEDVLSRQTRGDTQPSSETLLQTTSIFRRLAVALASGSEEAMNDLHGSQVENSDEKDRLNPPIPGIECDIDRIVNYVSCFSPVSDSKERADTLFTQFVNELQAALPSDSWLGMEAKPGIDSIRRYTYEEQKSGAHIDIDKVVQVGSEGQNTYAVSIFGWTF
jgi:hypothetical protein